MDHLRDCNGLKNVHAILRSLGLCYTGFVIGYNFGYVNVIVLDIFTIICSCISYRIYNIEYRVHSIDGNLYSIVQRITYISSGNIEYKV